MYSERGESVLESASFWHRDFSWIGTLLISLAVMIVTFVIYWPACQNEFVAWDDNHYVYNRPEVLAGLGWKQFVWAATAQVAANWHPLTLLSLQLDASLFGIEPFGFHLTSVILHSINSALTFVAVYSMTGCRWKSLFASGLFALHPMHVESVAWISERKDVLSGLFFLLTLMAYVHYVKAPSIGRYMLITLLLALGLSAKSMLVTVPCVLLLLDYWPLHRWKEGATDSFQKLLRLLLEKVPLLILTTAICAVTITYQKNAIQPLSRLSFDARIQNAVISYVVYLCQTFWPLGLSPYYARHAIPIQQVWMSLTVLVGVTYFVIWHRQRWPYLLVGWLWFMGMLVPVIGIFQVGHHSRADRYMYLPHLGLFLAMIWWFADMVRHSRRGAWIATSLTVLSLCFFGFLTHQQIAVWKDTKTLFQSALRLDPNNPLAAYVLAEFHYGEGNKSEAVRMMRHAIQVEDRSDCETLIMLGMLMADCGEYQDCVDALDKALKSYPNDAAVISNRAKALAGQGKWQEAAHSYRKASELAPDATNYRFYLAYALGKLGETEESQKISAAALRQFPSWPKNIASKAWKMSTSPDSSERGNFWPICLAEQACELTGGNQPEYLDVLAAAYAESGRFDEAVATGEHAIQEAEKQHNNVYADLLRQRLDLYRKGEPYRENTQRPTVKK